MALTTITPAVPVSSGSGASSSASALGAVRTIHVDGAFGGSLTVEASDDDTNFRVIAAFNAPGVITVQNASSSLRVTRAGTVSGTPAVRVSAVDVTTDIAVAAGTQTASTGTVVFSNSNGVTFGMSGSSRVTASVAEGATATGNLGAIAAGTQTATSGTVQFNNANGVTFGMDGSATVTASIATSLTNVRVSAGTTSNLLSAVTFADGSGVSFGLNASTLTASVAAGATATGNLGAIAAGTQTATSGTVQFNNANGVTFGMDGSATVTASIATSLTNVRVSAGTTSNLLSAITFADGNNVSFGLDASTVTASIATSLTNVRVSAGTTSNLLSAITFANGNGVTFGLNASTITASVAAAAAPTINFFDNLGLAGGTANLMNSIATQQGSMFLFPLHEPEGPFPGNMTASTVLVDMSGAPSGLQTNSHTFTVQLGIYTYSGSTLSILNSASTTMGAGADNATNTQLYQGARYLSFHSSVWSANPTFSQTNYVAAVNILSSNQAVDLSWLGQRYFLNVQRSGTMGAAATTGSTSNGWYPYLGIYSATTGAFPASIHISELDKFNFASGANFVPHVQFQNQLSAY